MFRKLLKKDMVYKIYFSKIKGIFPNFLYNIFLLRVKEKEKEKETFQFSSPKRTKKKKIKKTIVI